MWVKDSEKQLKMTFKNTRKIVNTNPQKRNLKRTQRCKYKSPQNAI